MRQLAGKGCLNRKGERKQQAGAQSAPRRIAADGIAEGDRPSMLVWGDPMHDTEQERGQQIDREADMRWVPQIDAADHPGALLLPPISRQSRHRPRSTT